MATVRSFGQCSLGEVHRIQLSDGAGMTVDVLSLGAAVHSITLPDQNGVLTDVCLGYDTPQEYLRNDAYLGACIGRCANRIAGACFSIHGQDYPLTANEGNNQLHGGLQGFDKKIWEFHIQDNSVTFFLHSSHLEEGYPGNLDVAVTYALTRPGCLEIGYHAQSDQDTVVNLTNHSYFNLGGHAGDGIEEQLLSLAASRYTPCGAGNIPTGEIRPVAGTPLDLRQPTRLGACLQHPALESTRGLDHNFVLDQQHKGPAALLWCPRTGIAMEMETDQEGVQVYTAGFLSQRQGKGGATYGPGQAVCLEAQHFPDAVHHENFPSPVLHAGEAYTQHTQYRFFVKHESNTKI